MNRFQLVLNHKKPKAVIQLPGSKSISNRLLIIHSMVGSDRSITNLSEADDTQRLLKIIEEVETCCKSRIPLIIDARNAGTIMRFLAALLVIKPGKWLLTGNQRMKYRPIGELVSALNELGAKIEYAEKVGFPPLRINGAVLNGNSVQIDPSVSSQFVSALMMIAPYLENGIKIHLKRIPVSFEYIQLTASLMDGFGVPVIFEGNNISISSGDYQFPESFQIEPDWSAASYWYEMVALSSEADIFLSGLGNQSLQGDRICADIFKNFGVSTSFEKNGVRLTQNNQVNKSFSYDFKDHPDLVPSVAATCSGLSIPAVISGVSHLRYKESDRIDSLKNELGKIGTQLTYKHGELVIMPSKKPLQAGQFFKTYGDHRMAMCLAPLAMIFDQVIVDDPFVVDKSYPGFWRDLERTGSIAVKKLSVTE